MNCINEPVRKSILDVVQHNLRAAGRKTYVTRVIYFGEYHGTPDTLQQMMENIIAELSTDYNMSITGLFLVYPSYYIHMLEAWEDIIYKHYKLIYAIKSEECRFGKAIPLPSYHHVHQRFFKEWYHVYIIPPAILGKFPDHTLEDIQKQMSNCLIKVYTLCEYISNAVREKSINIPDVLQNSADKVARYLPESIVLEFLLHVKSPVLKTVDDYLQMYSDVLLNVFWDDNNIWPPPCNFLPRDVFNDSDDRKILGNLNNTNTLLFQTRYDQNLYDK